MTSDGGALSVINLYKVYISDFKNKNLPPKNVNIYMYIYMYTRIFHSAHQRKTDQGKLNFVSTS